MSSGLISGCAAEVNRIKNIGLQLYTVRDMMAKSVEETLALTAQIGYKEVEVVQYFDKSPAEFKSILDSSGLTAPSLHVEVQQLRGDELKKLIENAHTVGHDYITMAWFKGADRETLDQIKGHVELFNHVGEECNKAGIKFAYHNHEFEFVAIDGVEPYDLFLSEVSEDLMVMEMDFYWMKVAGRDPFTYFDQYPERFHICHLKDMDDNGFFADVGKGTIDFNNILTRASDAGIKHFFAENDEPKDALEMIRGSYNEIQKFELG